MPNPDQQLTFQLSWFIGYMASPVGTDAGFRVTTFLAFNLGVCMGIFVVLHSSNAIFLYLFCVLQTAQVAMSSAPKICLTELLCSCTPSHFQF